MAVVAARNKAPEARRRLFGREAKRHGSFAMVQPQRSAKVTTAALRKVTEGGIDKTSDRTWQSAAFQMVDQIGELGYALNLKASVLSHGALQAQKWNAETRQWEETDDERALRVMAAFIGPQGGQAELLRRASLHLSIAGESILLGLPAQSLDVETGIYWEFLSTDELLIEGPKRMFRKNEGADRDQLPSEAYVARLWRAHPRYSFLADSEMRRVLDLCQEIVLLSQYVMAVAKSRLSSGILFVPDEMSFASEDSEDTDTNVDEDGDGIDEFEEELIEHMSAPVKDRTSAAGLVPLIMRGPAEFHEAVRLIDIARELDTFAKELRAEALGRLGRSLDIPPEIMEGKGVTTNHWSAYNIDADFIGRHVDPQGSLIAEFATFSYMRPMLEEYEEMAPEEAALFRSFYDASAIAPRQDEANTHRELYTMGPDLVSADSLRAANGVEDSAKPDEEEVTVRRAWDLIQLAPAQFYKLITQIPGFENVNVEDFAPAAPAGGLTGGTTPGLEGSTSIPITEGLNPKPQTQPALESGMGEPQRDGQPGFAVLVTQLSTASDAALTRALERAGARVINLAKRKVELKDRLRAVESTRVLTMLRPGDLRDLGLTSKSLMSGAWDDLSLKARRWIGQELRSQGIDSLTADDRAALAASQLCSALDDWVAKHLHDQFPLLSNGMRVPSGLVLNSLGSVILDAVG